MLSLRGELSLSNGVSCDICQNIVEGRPINGGTGMGGQPAIQAGKEVFLGGTDGWCEITDCHGMDHRIISVAV